MEIRADDELYVLHNKLRDVTLYLYDYLKKKEKERFRSCFTLIKNDVPTLSEPLEESQLNNSGELVTVLTLDQIFNEKEFKKMPKLKDLSYRYRKDRIHEFRYRRNGYSKCFCSTDLKVARDKAKIFIAELNDQERTNSNKKNIDFVAFAESWFEKVKKINVAKNTYERDYHRFKKHIKPYFKGKNIADLKAPVFQEFLNFYILNDQPRTAEGCFYILRPLMQYAFENEYINRNPLNVVKIPVHQRTTGKALTLELEKEFIQNIAGYDYELHFIILLYTGCRPCELPTIQFVKDGFVTFQNMKQHHRKTVYKDIPITPMLAPYVERIKSALPLKTNTELAKRFSARVPGYRMYDLRHTFATRCQECGVPQEIVAEWMGHSAKALIGQVYTHISPKVMLEHAKKVEY